MLTEQMLEWFLVVADEMSIRGAAQRLQQATTTVARTVRDIEADLGETLLERSPQGSHLTAAGDSFLIDATMILERIRRAREATRFAASGKTPTLRIGHVSASSYDLLSSALRRLHQLQPTVATILSEDLSGPLLSQLLDGKLDLALVRPPASGPNVTGEALIREPLRVAIPADHPLANQTTVSVSQLSAVPLVGFPRAFSPGTYDRWITMFRQVGSDLEISGNQALHPASILTQVEAGLGAAFTTDAIVERYSSDGVVARPLTDESYILLSMAWKTDNGSPYLGILVDCRLLIL